MARYFSASTKGFYNSKFHGEAMPPDAKEISEALYLFLLGKKIDADQDGLPFAVAATPPTLEALKAAALKELNKTSQALADQFTASYPEFEKLTWEDQRREAIAWNADNNTPTPYIDVLAAERGIDRIDYLQRTFAKSVSFATAAQKLVGQRQKYEDQIEAATTPEALAAIEFIFTLD